MKIRLDKALVDRKIVNSRSQAESYIRLGKISVDGVTQKKPGFLVKESSKIEISQKNQYVSRAGMKLESVAEVLRLDFRGATVLDVGSSTGGFTDFSLMNGAKKVLAVDVGTNQLHPKLRADSRVDVFEKTDIRDFKTNESIDIVVIDVSFISLREILPSVAKIAPFAKIVAMVKPQFEAGKNGTERGVVKNNAVRRKILQDFERGCAGNGLIIIGKRDSEVKGSKGNQERFYLLRAK